MKKYYLAPCLVMLSLTFSLSINAQFEDTNTDEVVYEMPKPETPKWVSDKGYWVIKSNKNTPKECTIYFYNNDKLLVYQEEIKDRKLKLKNKTLMKLKAALEEAVDNYDKGIIAMNKNEIVLQHLQR